MKLEKGKEMAVEEIRALIREADDKVPELIRRELALMDDDTLKDEKARGILAMRFSLLMTVTMAFNQATQCLDALEKMGRGKKPGKEP